MPRLNHGLPHRGSVFAVLRSVIIVLACLAMTLACTAPSGPPPPDGSDGGNTDDDPGDGEPAHDKYFPFESDDTVALGLVTGRYYYQLAESPEEIFDDWYNLGVRWIRIEFETFWDHRPGGGTASGYDDPIVQEKIDVYETIVEEAHTRHIKVMGLLAWNSIPGGPGGLTFDGNTLTQESLDAYVESAKWHLSTFDVDAIEIWNEPWGFFFGGSGGARLDQYARLLIETYREVKPEHPDTPFLAPVTVNAEPGEWLGHHGWSDTYEFRPEDSIFNNSYMQSYRDGNDGALPLDAISWHPYGSGEWQDPEGNFYFGRDFNEYYDIITGEQAIYLSGATNDQVWFEDVSGRDIVGDYPIWFSEYGWQSRTESEETRHAEHFRAMVNAMQEHPQIKVATLYTYQDDEDTADSEGNAFGIVKDSDESYEPKEPYYEFAVQTTGVGVFEDGSIDYDYVEAYMDHGGRIEMGAPLRHVVDIGSSSYQDFENGTDGPVRLIQESDGTMRVEPR